MAIVDLTLDTGDDLIGKRLTAFVADDQRERVASALRCGLALSPDQYSYGYRPKNCLLLSGVVFVMIAQVSIPTP